LEKKAEILNDLVTMRGVFVAKQKENSTSLENLMNVEGSSKIKFGERQLGDLLEKQADRPSSSKESQDKPATEPGDHRAESDEAMESSSDEEMVDGASLTEISGKIYSLP
jgi:hypothetical protein